MQQSPPSQAQVNEAVRTRAYRDGIGWLAAAVVAFAAAVLLFTPLRASLAWDETVYASQIANHVPVMFWGSERARGMPLLLAPVTLLTSSVVVLRVYLALIASAALFLALLAWRRLIPAWVLAISGVLFGGLWVAQSQASQAYPNYWIAIGGVAGVGLFLQVLARPAPRWPVLALLAVTAAFTSLMRPADAVFLFGPMVAVALVLAVRRPAPRRYLAALAAMLVGLAIGYGEWAVEAFLYFKGPFARFHAANQAVGGTKFNLVNNLRIIDGGRTSSVAGYPSLSGWSHPWLLLWWLGLLLLAILGVWAARRGRPDGARPDGARPDGAWPDGGGWLLGLLPVACAVSIYVLYMFPARDNSRYLLPAWGLLAIPAALGAAWLVTRPRPRARLAAMALVVAFIAVELGTQHAVLTSQSASVQALANTASSTARSLRDLGVRAPCVVTSVNRPHFVPVSEPAAFYAGCTYVWGHRRPPKAASGRVIVLVQGTVRPWHYARHWDVHRLSGGGNVFAYIEPPTARAARS